MLAMMGRPGLNPRLVPSLLLIVLALFVLPGFVHRAHASSAGLVCLADLSAVNTLPANPCPAGPGAVFDGPLTSPNHQIRIGVFVNGSGGFSVFDIALQANSTVLKPAGIDLSGTILKPPQAIILECVGGKNYTIGGNCSPATTPDTIRIAAGSFGGLTATPSTGLLFTAIYNITANASTRLSVNFLSGCLQDSSIAGTTLCVAFANGGRTTVPETVRAATFDNRVSIPYLTVSSSPTLIGPIIVGSSQSLRLTLTGQNGWNLLGCPCQAAISYLSDQSLKILFNTTSPSVPSSGSAFVNMTVSGNKAGRYSVDVLAQYSSLDAVNNPDTLVAHASIQLAVSDFAVVASSASGQVNSPITSTITISPLYGFTGSVTLADTVPIGLTCGSISPSIISGSGTAGLTCSSATNNVYVVTITGTYGQLAHSTQASFILGDFYIVAGRSASVMIGVSTTINFTLGAVNGFARTVTLTENGVPGLTCSNITPGTLTGSGTASVSCAAQTAGNYTLTVTGSSGPLSHTAQAVLGVQDYAVSASSYAVSVTEGSAVGIDFALTGLNGFNQTVNLSVVNPIGLTITQTRATLLPSKTVRLDFTGNTVGLYRVIITFSSGPVSHSVNVSINVTAPISGSSNLLGLAPTLFYSLLGLLVVMVTAVLAIGVRSRRKRNQVFPGVVKGSPRKKKS